MTDAGRPEAALAQSVLEAAPRLLALSEAQAAAPTAPGKWSRKEILGHLIDSASNNHQRFVRAQFTDDLIFPGYEQERWVAVQKYGAAPWHELVELWRLFNLQLARVIAAIPAAVRHQPRARHNLHELAWRPVAQDEVTSLEYFLRDYVDHLQHHLRQVLDEPL